MRRMTNEGTDKTAAIQDSRDHRRMMGGSPGGIGTSSVELSDVLIQSIFSPKFFHWRHLVTDWENSPETILSCGIHFQPGMPPPRLAPLLADGVMAAQGSLKPLVMVRIHVGQPFSSFARNRISRSCCHSPGPVRRTAGYAEATTVFPLQPVGLDPSTINKKPALFRRVCFSRGTRRRGCSGGAIQEEITTSPNR